MVFFPKTWRGTQYDLGKVQVKGKRDIKQVDGEGYDLFDAFMQWSMRLI